MAISKHYRRACEFLRRYTWRILAGAAVVALLAAGVLWMLNGWLNHYVASEGFRAEMDKATAKGLHLTTAHYQPIRRTGSLTVMSDGFDGGDGWKAITEIKTREVTGRFNPWGVFLRRWQLDEVRIADGKVGIQTYEPKPESKPPKPWYAIVLPDRVYLKQVTCEPTDITWRFRNEKAGFFQTKLLITPHGRDFEYRATGGTMKSAMIPDLELRQTHLLITKELLSLYRLDLQQGDGSIHARGKAGMKGDKSVDVELAFGKVPVRPWVGPSWRKYFSGVATGGIHWHGKDAKLEVSAGEGTFRMNGGRVTGAPFLHELATATAKKSLETLTLDQCSLGFDWKYPKINIKEIAVEDKGKFRIEGSLIVNERKLNGTLQLGAAPEYLEWLPKAELVFTRQRDGYLWTNVKISGTIKEPQEDLSPRIMAALKKSPGAYLGLFFREVGEWLEKAFDGK